MKLMVKDVLISSTLDLILLLFPNTMAPILAYTKTHTQTHTHTHKQKTNKQTNKLLPNCRNFSSQSTRSLPKCLKLPMWGTRRPVCNIKTVLPMVRIPDRERRFLDTMQLAIGEFITDSSQGLPPSSRVWGRKGPEPQFSRVFIGYNY